MEGVVTIQSMKYEEFMITSDDKLDEVRRHVSTRAINDDPSGPQEASRRWKLVRCGGSFRIQNMMTREWMYANAPKYNGERRRVLTFDRKGKDPPEEDLSYQWHLAPYGAAFGIKNAKHDEWLYANGPKLSEECRHVLAWVPGGNDPKADPSAAWLIQPVLPCLGRSVKQDLQRRGAVVGVESSGYDHGNAAAFYLDGVRIDFDYSRGLNVAVLHPTRLQVLSLRAYDICASYGERNQLAADLSALPDGHIVLAALKDSGMDELSAAAKMVLRSLGAAFSSGKHREGYALIGVKGGDAVAEAQGYTATATGTISRGDPEAGGVTLKLKYDGAFRRLRVRAPLALADFEEVLRSATGVHRVAGLRLAYVDEEGDRCVISDEATLREFFRAAGQDVGGTRVLRVEVESLSTLPMHPQQEETAEESLSTGSFELLPPQKVAEVD